MSISSTCNCRGQKRSVVQDYIANGWWPAYNEWTRHCSAHYELASSNEVVDKDEAPRSVNSDDEVCELDGRWYGRRGGRLEGGRDGGLGSGWYGQQNDGRDGGLGSRWYGRRNSERDGGLVGGRVGGWDGTPRSSYRGTQVKLIFYWDKCCQWCNVPDAADNGYPTSESINYNHRDYNDGDYNDGISDTTNYGGRSNDRGRVVLAARHRRPQSSKRQRSRLVHGPDWF